ncbi:MAG: hypothetical protein ABIF77_04310 [bacterium]
MSDRLQTQDSDQDYSWDDWANEEPGRQAVATELVDELTEDEMDLGDQVESETFGSAPRVASHTESWAEPDSASLDPATDESKNEQPLPDGSDYQDSPENLETDQPLNASDPLSHAGPASVPSRGSLVVIYLLSLLVSAVAAAYAVLVALQGQWQQLWPLDSGLYQDIGMVVGGVFVLGALGSVMLSRSAALARKRYRQAETVAERIAALDPANEQSWCETWEQSPPGVGAFLKAVSETMERQRSKLDRYLGLKGELFRLEKTITCGLRDEVEGPYDNPAVARLGEASAKLFDAAAAAGAEQAARQGHCQGTDAVVAEGLRQVHFWNQNTAELLVQQHQAMSHLIPELKRLRGEIRNGPQLAERLGHATQYAQEISDRLAKLPEEFEGQTERVRKLGDAWTELSGTDIAWKDPDVEPMTDLGIERFDPFVKQPADQEGPAGTAELTGYHPDHLDPFASGTSDLESVTTFTGVVKSGYDSPFAVNETESPAKVATLVSEQSAASMIEPALPETEERIYDLAEFDAVALDEELLAGNSTEERIYELAEFGAVALN